MKSKTLNLLHRFYEIIIIGKIPYFCKNLKKTLQKDGLSER